MIRIQNTVKRDSHESSSDKATLASEQNPSYAASSPAKRPGNTGLHSKFKRLGKVEKSVDHSGYIYPVKPGSDEWNIRVQSEGPVALCQIPDEILKSLPTEALARTCLSYPLRGEIFSFSNPKTGLEILRSDFNGLQELYQRGDSKDSLVSIFSEFSGKNIEIGAKQVEQLNESGILAGVIDVFFFTTLLESMVDSMDNNQKELITSKVISMLSEIRGGEPSASEGRLAVFAADMIITYNAQFVTSNGDVFDREYFKRNNVNGSEDLVSNSVEKLFEIVDKK
jgi:hypothetical protein